MAEYSSSSLERLSTCHPDLIRLFNAVLKKVDHAILAGHRPEWQQNQFYRDGKTNARWPNSKHNKVPSHAVDAMPVPIKWDDAEGIKAFADIVKETALELGIAIRWGGNFKSLSDRDHFELINP